MDLITLEHRTQRGLLLKAQFAPQAGMNLVSYSCAGGEVIDQQTLPLFSERMAGLGALIGPHFHHRKEGALPPFEDAQLFPHIALLKQQGKKEYFSHGIGRYVPWRVLAKTSSSLQAHLCGSDHFGGILLKEIEGMDFDMHYGARLSEEGLTLHLKFKTQKPGVMGLHTYYVLQPSGCITSSVQDVYNDAGVFHPLDSTWKQEGRLRLPAKGVYDYGFLSAPDVCQGTVHYGGDLFHLALHYKGSQPCSWQLYRPEGSSYICIEPIAARNPRALEEKSGEMTVSLSIDFH